MANKKFSMNKYYTKSINNRNFENFHNTIVKNLNQDNIKSDFYIDFFKDNDIDYKKVIEEIKEGKEPDFINSPEFKQYTKNAFNSIAPLSSSIIDNIIDGFNNRPDKSQYTMVQGVQYFKKNLPNENNSFKQENSIKEFTNFFNTITNKTHTGKELHEETIRNDFLYQQSQVERGYSIQRIKELKNNLKKSNSIIAFDLETTGGKDKNNIDQLINITEFSGIQFSKDTNGKFSKYKKITNVLPLSDEDYSKTKQLIIDAQKNGASTTQHKVILDYYSKFSNPKNKIIDNNGSYSMNVVEDIENATPQLAMEGLHYFNNTVRPTDIQNGLSKQERDFIELIKTIQTSYDGSDSMVAGHNITKFDINKLNQILAKNDKIKKAVGFNSIDINPNNNIDTYKIAETYNHFKNINTYFDNETIKYVKDNNLTLLKNEAWMNHPKNNIDKSIFKSIIDDSTAHTATTDTLSNAISILGQNGDLDSFVFSMLDDLSNESSNHINFKNYKDYLFYNDKSIYKNDFFGNNPLNFAFDKDTGMYMTGNGKAFTIDNEKINYVEDFGKATFNKHVPYTINNVSKYSPTKKELKELEKINPNYAVSELYYATLKPYSNNDDIRRSREYVIVGRNKDEVLDNIGTPIAKGMKKNQPKIINKEYDKQLKEKFSKHYTVSNGEVTYNDTPYSTRPFFEQVFIDGMSNITLEDSARRYNDEISYSKAKKLLNLQEKIEEIQELPDFKDKSYEEILNESYHYLNEEIKEKGLYEASKEIADNVSQNKIVGTYNPLNSILNVLGYHQPGKDIKHLPQQSTIKNIENSMEKIQSISPIMQNIVDYIDSDDKYRKLNTDQKNFLFTHIFNGLQSKAYYNTKDKDALGIEKPLPMSKKDLMYYEFDLDEKLFNFKDNNKILAKQPTHDSSKFFRVNLNKKEGDISKGLLSTLNIDSNHLTPQELDDTKQSLMTSFISQLKEDDNLSDIFKDFNIENGISFKNNGETITDADTKVVTREIQNRLTKLVDNNPEAGKIRSRTYNSGYLPNNILKDYYKNIEFLNDSIKEISSGLPTPESFSDESLRNNVRKYLKENHKQLEELYNDPLNIQEKLGVTKKQALYQHNLYKKSMSELEDVYNDFFTNVAKMNLSPIFKDDTIIVSNNLKDSKGVVLDRLPKIRMGSRGELTLAIKNNEYRLNKELIEKDGVITLGTNIKDAFNKMDASFRYMAEKGVEKDNELNTVLSMVSNFTEKLAESPAISNHDSIEAQSNFVLGTDIIGKFLKKPDVLKSLKANNEQEETALLEFITSMATNENDNFITNFMSGDLEAYGNFGEQIKDILFDLGYINKEAYDTLKDEASLLVKDTSTPKAEQNIGAFQLDPFAMFINEQRPNQFQEHDMTVDKEQANKRAKILSAGDKTNKLFSFSPSIGNQKVMKQKFNISNNQASSAEINAFHTSEDILKTLINKKKASMGQLSEKEEKLFEILDSVSLHDGEGIINPVFAQAIASEDTQQYVSASKDVLLDLKNDKKTSDKIEDLKGKILPKYEISNGKLKVSLQKEGKYVKRFDEIIQTLGYENVPMSWRTKADIASIKFGFYKDGTELSEKQINKIIQDNNISSIDELYKYFNNHGDMRFSVNNANLAGYKKVILNNAEKMEAASPLATPGSLNKKISQALAGLSDDEAITGDITIKDFKERIWQQDSLKNISKKIYNLKDFDKTKFESPEEFYQALLQEELEPSNFLFNNIVKESLEQSGVKNITPAIIESSSTIKHQSVNLRLYSDISLIKEEAKKQGLSVEQLLNSEVKVDNKNIKFSEILQGKINGETKSLFYIDPKYKDTIMVSQEYEGGHYDDKINAEALKAFMDKFGLKTDDKYGLFTQDTLEDGDKINTGQILKVLASVHTEDSKLTSANHNKYEIERGISIGNREVFMMNRTKADTVYRYLFDKTKTGKMEQDRFNRLTNHLVDKEGKLKATEINRPLLSYFTNNLINEGYLSQEDLLKEQNGEKIRLSHYLKDDKYKYLSNIGKSFNQGKDISLTNAQRMYDIQNTIKSVNYNQGYMDTKQAKKIFGESVPINKLSFGSNRNLKTAKKSKHNIYKPQIVDFYSGLEDLGLDNFETPNGRNRFIATPGFHPKEHGDSAIPYKHEKQLKKLHGMHQQLIDINNGIGINTEQGETKQSVLNHKLNKYQKEIASFKDQINKDGLSKDGLYGQHIKSRLTQSATGKISGKMVRLPGDLKGIEETKDLVKYMSQVDNKLPTKDLDKFLSKVKFNDQSIVENMEQGNYFDFRFLSKEAFKNMGFYDQDNLLRQAEVTKKEFNEMAKDKQKELLKQSKKNIDNSLKTGGVTGLSGRYPSIYDESFKPTQYYLSNELHGHRILSSAEGILAMQGDYDGDPTPNSFIKFGKMKNITSIEMEKVIKEKDKEKKDELMHQLQIDNKDIKAYNDLQLFMEYQGRGMNVLQRKKINEMRVKSHKEAISDINDYLTPSRYFYNFNGKPSKKLREREDLAINQYMSIKQSAIDKLTEKGIKNDNKNYENILIKQMDQVANGLSDEWKESMVYGLLNTKQSTAITAAHKKLSIAAVNPTLFSLRRASEIGFTNKPNMKHRDYYQELVQGMATAIEQTNISTKNSTDLAQEIAGKTNRFLKSYKKALYGNDGSKFKKFLMNDVEESTIQEFVIDPMKHKIASSEIKTTNKEELIDDMVKYIMNLKNAFGGTDNLAGVLGAMRMGQSVTTIKNPGKSTKYMIGNSTPADYLGKKIIESDSYFEGSQQLEKLVKNNTQEKLNKLSLIDGREAMEKSRTGIKEETKHVLSNVSETIAKSTNLLSSKSLAVGALGLAGGVLAAGFIGGHPTRPAENHASEQSSEDNNTSDFYTVPQLSDNAPYGQRSQNGYVLNINAETVKDQKQIVNSIQNAVSQNIPTDVNLAININNNNSNINDRDIEKILKGAL